MAVGAGPITPEVGGLASPELESDTEKSSETPDQHAPLTANGAQIEVAKKNARRNRFATAKAMPASAVWRNALKVLDTEGDHSWQIDEHRLLK